MLLLFVKHKRGRFRALDHRYLLLIGGTGAMSLAESIILLMASTLIAGLTYASIFHLKATAYQSGIKALNIGDIILHPYLLPDDFYILIFMTLAFTASMTGLAIVLQSMIKRQPVCLRVLPLPIFCTVFTSYCFLLNEKMPKFWVTTCNELFKIPSSWLVWICCQCIVLILFTIWFLGKLILSFFCNSEHAPTAHPAL